MEHRAVNVTISGDDHEITPDNCEIWRFRHPAEGFDEPLDYLHIWRDTPEIDVYEHTMCFKNVPYLIWMGGAVMREETKIQKVMEEEMGKFTDLSGGWRPMVMIEDEADEAEKEWYIQLLLKDLKNTEGISDDF